MQAGEDFDYIVVGGGGAGCVLAARLSEKPENRVLLLEAGGKDNHFWLHVPIGYARLFGDPRFNWHFRVEPEEQLKVGPSTFFQGKVLGGGTAVNGMVHQRGQPQDYDNWAQAGLTGWGWDEVLPFFRKLEDQQRGESDYHGIGGPVRVIDPPGPRNPLCEAFIRAGEEMGWPRNDDFNGERQDGLGYLQINAKNGRRVSSAIAYLRPARRRANLTVLTGAEAHRVLFEGRRASAVEATHEGQKRVFRARREIVLSAGGLGSPLILQRSGVGPGELLRSHGIDVVHDNPHVGRNLRNHFNPGMAYRVKQKVTFNDTMRTRLGRTRMFLDYLLFRKGPMAWGPAYVAGFFRSDPRLATPDMVITLFLFAAEPGQMRLTKEPGLTVMLAHLRPESRGSVEIASADPSVLPTLRFNFLSDPGDRAAMEAGLKILRELMRKPALQPFVGEEFDAFPDWSGKPIDPKKEVRGAAHHLTGSCRMAADESGVTDARLRVRGVEGLRVADCSVFPTMVSGGTSAPAMMVGEKAAHMILEDGR